MTHEHLNDEQLSAYLDGELHDEPSPVASDRTLDARIAGCDTCRRRLAALSDARALVRRPVVAVAPSVRAGAVESAIAEALGPETGAGSTSELAVRRSRRPARSSGVLVGAAAAVAVLVVAVGASLGLAHSSSPTASSASAPVRTPHSAATQAAPEQAAAPGTTANPDLGSVSSPENLRSRLAPLLAPVKGRLGVASSGLSAKGAPDNDSAAPTAGSFAAAGSVPATFATCVAAAERVAGTTGTLELVATATYRHTPALVAVIEVTGPSSKAASGPLAVVVARSGCRVLVRTTA